MMDVSDTIESMKSAISERLSANIAYGEPVTSEGVTVIPVARVMLGFGAGGGVGEPKQSSGNGETAQAPVGGGGGGGGMVQPLGFIEIDSSGARWVPLEPSRAELALRAAVLAIVLLPLGGRRGFFGRLLLVVVGQALAGRFAQPSLPPLEGFRFGRAGATG